jgi:ABC-type sugar transport system permease subunit
VLKIVTGGVSSVWTGISSYYRDERARYGVFFVLPSLFFFCIFIVWPVFYSFYLGFYAWNPLDPEPIYVGLENYRELFGSQEFIRVILNTLIFIAGDLVLVLIGSISLALALNQGLRGTTLFRSIYYSPVVTSLVATAVIWLWILDPQFGIVNQILRALNIPAPGWGADMFWAMPTVILTFSWREVGYFTVIYLAGLQGIPEELKEAARIDGCGPWRVFRHVTLPLLMPTTFFVLVLGTIRATQNAFAVIYVMTAGGPVGSTNVIVLYLYEQAFTFFRLGYASAVAYVLFVFVFGVTLVQFYFMKQRMEIYR